MHTITSAELSAATSTASSPLSEVAIHVPGLGGEMPPAPIVGPGADPLPPILIAEDDMDDAFFIQRLIKKTGTKHPLKLFDDGTEVVNYLAARARSGAGVPRRRSPLLLFLDLNMRGLGGFEFLSWVREQKDIGPLTTVVLTNSSDPNDMTRAHELGAHRYLVKYPSVQTFGTIVTSVYPQTVF